MASFFDQISNTLGGAIKGAGNAVGQIFSPAVQRFSQQATDFLSQPIQNQANNAEDLVNIGKGIGTQGFNYFNPTNVGTYNNPIQNFWNQTHAAQSLGQAQNFTQNTMPKLRVNWAQDTQQGVANALGGGQKAQMLGYAAALPVGIPQSLINAPSDIAHAGTQIGQDIGSGAILKPQRALGDLAEAAMPIMSIWTMGEGPAILRSVVGDSWKKAVLKGFAGGTAYGGAFGLGQGLAENRNAQNVGKQFEQSLPYMAGGMLGGGILGSVLAPSGKVFFGGARGQAARLAQSDLVPARTMQDAYKILRVSPQASLDDVRMAYTNSLKDFHPQFGGTNEALQVLNNAYEMVTRNVAPEIIGKGANIAPKWSDTFGGATLSTKQLATIRQAITGDDNFYTRIESLKAEQAQPHGMNPNNPEVPPNLGIQQADHDLALQNALGEQPVADSSPTLTNEQLAMAQLPHNQSDVSSPTLTDQELGQLQLRQANPGIQYPDMQTHQLDNLVRLRENLSNQINEGPVFDSKIHLLETQKAKLEQQVNQAKILLRTPSKEAAKPATGLMSKTDLVAQQKEIQRDIQRVDSQIRVRPGRTIKSNILLKQKNDLIEQYNQMEDMKSNYDIYAKRYQPDLPTTNRATLKAQASELSQQLNEVKTQLKDAQLQTKTATEEKNTRIKVQLKDLESQINDERSRVQVKSAIEAPTQNNEVLPQLTDAERVHPPTQQAPQSEKIPVGKSSDSQILEKAVTDLDMPNDKKVNIIDHFVRTPENVLEKMGLGNIGKELRGAYEHVYDQTKTELNMVTDWSKRVSKDENQQIFKFLDGQPVNLSDNALQVAGEIRDYLVGWADRLGLPPERRITNYITHIFDGNAQKSPEFSKLITKKLPSSVYDPFVQERLGKQGYKEDTWGALDAYIKRAVKKESLDPIFGRLSDFSNKMEQSQYDYIREYISDMNGTPGKMEQWMDNLVGQGKTGQVTRTARKMVYRGLLGLNPVSALKNLMQGANTYAALGEKYTTIGYANVVKNLPRFLANKETELERVGVLQDNFIEDRQLSSMKQALEATDKGLFYMFNQAEKINRGAAYFGAKAKYLAEHQGAPEQEAIDYAKYMVRKTQFNFGAIDLPLGMQGDIAKTMAQFQTYTIKQAEFLGNMAFRDKDFLGLIRYTAASLLMIGTVGQAIGMKPTDMVPSFRVGMPPTAQLPYGAYRAATESQDKFGNKLSTQDRIFNSDAVKGFMNYIPAGAQITKTASAALENAQGGAYTKGGRLKYPATSGLKGYIVGPSKNENAQQYQNQGLGALSDNETKQYQLMVKGGENPQDAYTKIRTNQADQASFKKSLEGYKTATGEQKPSFLSGIMNMLGMGPKDTTATSNIPTETGNPLIDALNKEKGLDDRTKKIKAIYESGMNAEQIQKALQAEGIDAKDAETDMLKSLSIEHRAPLVHSILSAVTDPTKQIETIHELAQKNVLTTGITAEWVSKGLIDYETKKAIDKEIDIANGTRSATSGTGVGIHPAARQFFNDAMNLRIGKAPLGANAESNAIQAQIAKSIAGLQFQPGDIPLYAHPKMLPKLPDSSANLPKLVSPQFDASTNRIKFKDDAKPPSTQGSPGRITRIRL